MRKLKDWWNEGGGRIIDYDNSGEPMYSMSRGETITLLSVCFAGLVALIAVVKIVLFSH